MKKKKKWSIRRSELSICSWNSAECQIRGTQGPRWAKGRKWSILFKYNYCSFDGYWRYTSVTERLTDFSRGMSHVMLRTTGATLGRPQVAIHRKFAMPHFLLLAYYRPILIYLLAYFILTVLVANCFLVNHRRCLLCFCFLNSLNFLVKVRSSCIVYAHRPGLQHFDTSNRSQCDTVNSPHATRSFCRVAIGVLTSY